MLHIYNLTRHSADFYDYNEKRIRTIPVTPSGVLGTPQYADAIIEARISMRQTKPCVHPAVGKLIEKHGMDSIAFEPGEPYLAVVQYVGGIWKTLWTGGMPERTPHVAYFVSSFLVQWAQDVGRDDLFTGADAVRDGNGNIIGAKGVKLPADIKRNVR